MIKLMLFMIFGSFVFETIYANSEVSCCKNSKPGCGQNCGKHCSDYPPGSTRVSFVCPEICKLDGCDCDPGFVFDDYTNSCVVPNDCKVKALNCTGKHEIYEICPAKCPFGVCGIDDRLVDCAASPQIGDANCAPPACKCRNGFYRNDKGKCVKFEDCPKCDGKPNEVYDPCIPPCPPRRCDVDDRLIRCKDPPTLGDADCKAGCRCEDGYKRNKNGTCIPQDQCQPFCGENEIPSNCINGGCFGARYCSQKGRPIICVDLIEGACKKGCLCKKGYLRDEKTGRCVLEEKCPAIPKCKGVNQVYDFCPVQCPPRNCSVNAAIIRCAAPPVLGDPECRPGCRCKDGFKFDKHGICIPENQCDPFCNENEVPSNCTNGGCYGARYCSQKGAPIKCVKLGENQCIKGCLCKKGYLRDELSGICVKEDKCPETPKCEAPNTVFEYCPALCPPRRCDVNAALILCIIPPQLGDPECEPGCQCKNGYKTNHEGICVPEDECPPFCGPNEEPSDCTNGGCWSARYCSEIGEPIKCAKIPVGYCIKGCLCKEGYLRNDETGECVPQSECPNVSQNCTEPNQVYDSCFSPSCPPRRCDVDDRLIKCAPPNPGDSNCMAGCRCRDGYKKDDKGICVPQEQCPPFCGPNEEPSDCVNGGCWTARYCSERGDPEKCAVPEQFCEKGCLCKEGYLRNDENGECVLIEECPPKEQNKCTLPNEVYVVCPGCSPQTCETANRTYNCPSSSPSIRCRGACRCKPGYFRNLIGECISEKNCLKCTGPHEYYSCGGACDNVCATLSEQNQTSCPIINVKCNEKCYCESGYARDKNGVCIPIKDCPPPHQTCPSPPGKCGRNEIYDSCPPSCSSQSCQNVTVPCNIQPAVCRPACRCKKGYYRNNEDKCVTRKECETCSGPNEYYDRCTPICSPQSCFSLVGPRPQCLPIAPGQCFGACRCKDGYFRDDNGTCIPEEKCQPCSGKKNEVYNSCAASCSSDTCASLYEDNSDCVGAAVCNRVCQCQKGYKRNEDGECIPIAECPCNIGESYKSDDGCNTCSCLTGKRGDLPCTKKACNISGPKEPVGVEEVKETAELD